MRKMNFSIQRNTSVWTPASRAGLPQATVGDQSKKNEEKKYRYKKLGQNSAQSQNSQPPTIENRNNRTPSPPPRYTSGGRERSLHSCPALAFDWSNASTSCAALAALATLAELTALIPPYLAGSVDSHCLRACRLTSRSRAAAPPSPPPMPSPPPQPHSRMLGHACVVRLLTRVAKINYFKYSAGGWAVHCTALGLGGRGHVLDVPPRLGIRARPLPE